MARRNGKLEQILCATGPELGDADCKGLVSSFACEGRGRAIVIRMHETGAHVAQLITSKDPNVQVIHRGIETFSHDFSPGKGCLNSFETARFYAAISSKPRNKCLSYCSRNCVSLVPQMHDRLRLTEAANAVSFGVLYGISG